MKCIICLSPFESDEAFIPELDCSCTFITHHECWEEWEKIGDCLYCRPKYIIQEMPPQNNIAVHKIIIFVFCSYFAICSAIYIIIRMYLFVAIKV